MNGWTVSIFTLAVAVSLVTGVAFAFDGDRTASAGSFIIAILLTILLGVIAILDRER